MFFPKSSFGLLLRVECCDSWWGYERNTVADGCLDVKFYYIFLSVRENEKKEFGKG